MSKLKINLDRPDMSSADIAKKMNFDQLLVNHSIMSKPFYKTPWFYGVSSIASVTLIAGSIYALKPEGDILATNTTLRESTPLLTDSPPELIKASEIEIPIIEKTVPLTIKNTPIDKKQTLTKTTNQKPTDQVEKHKEVKPEPNVVINQTETTKTTFSLIDLHPRISGKINGNITKKELLNDQGLVTNADIEVISFELHLIDGSGGKVFINDGYSLTTEMKNAFNVIGVGDEIYFENIEGKANTGEIIRLSPLRYVLLN
jgi:hypothetical protein